MIFRSINPYSGQIIFETESLSSVQLQDRLNASAAHFPEWKRTTLSHRLELLLALADLLEKEVDHHAVQMAEEMGKTFTEGRAEILKSASTIRFFVEKSPDWLSPKTVALEAKSGTQHVEPLGGILLVMPWNFPFWQILRAAIPALCAGNVILLKHAPNVMRAAQSLENLFQRAGFPEQVFINLPIGIEDLERTVAHKAVAAISFTGSEAAGRSLASLAGKYLRKCVLELGGSDPFLVLPDADVAFAGSMAAKARLINNGQSCIAAKRFLVHHSIEGPFIDAFIQELEKFVVGNPILPETSLGPQARPDLVENLHRQLSLSENEGAQLVYQMMRPHHEGNFFLPVILKNVRPDMTCFVEELFGPIAPITTYKTIDEALLLANHSKYGLGASIYTKDVDLAQRLALQLECGNVAINSMVRSQPAMPFGGIKASGYGKELSQLGLMEFTNAKSVVVG